MVCLQTSWSSKTQCPRFVEESLFQKLGCNLTILCLLIKKVLLPIFVLLHSCIWWITIFFNYFIMNMHIINHWYIYTRYCWKNLFFLGELENPWKLWKRLKKEKTKLRSTFINQVFQVSFLFLFHFLHKLIVCKCLSKFVTPETYWSLFCHYSWLVIYSFVIYFVTSLTYFLSYSLSFIPRYEHIWNLCESRFIFIISWFN